MTNPPNDVLFSSDLWELALEKYASATHVTVKLFDSDLRIVFGPIHPTPLFQLFDGGGYDPGLFVQCACQCLAQTVERPAVTVSKIHGLAVIGTSLMLDGKIVGAAVAGYVLLDFSQLSEIQRVAKDAHLNFGRLWQVAREQSPVSQQRLTVNGELLQVLGDALLRENARTRQSEEAGLKLQQTASVLRESEERYRTLFDLGPVGVYSCEVSGVIRDFNRRAVELWGREPRPGDTDERWCGSFKLHRPDGAFLPHEQCPMAEVLSGKIPEARDQEVQIERPDGSRVTVIVNIRPLKNEHGEILGAINCFVDITERKQMEEARERLAAIVESSDDAMISMTLEGAITTWNRGAERFFGYTAKEAIGRNITFIVPPDRLNEEATILERISRAERIEHFETLRMRKDGAMLDISLTISPVKDADRDGQITGAVIVFHDVSMARSMMLQMSHLAQHDTLTNLPNRLMLNDRLTQAISSAHRNSSQAAVMFLDLDQFKHINDSLGHAIGDKLLQSVAARLLGCVRNCDTVSRQGGDEFLVLLSEIKHSADASITARKILNALATPHRIDEHTLNVTASIGLSTYPEDGDDADVLIKNADMAMYQAKEKGRNNYQFFKKDMNLRAVDRQSFEGCLREALEYGQFVLHYQPKVNLTTGAISGVEALLRWMRPDRGLILPLEFLPIAEDCGLILPIGRWALREACSQVRNWTHVDLRVPPMSVNVSSLEFRSEGFLENLRAVLKDTDLDPCYLELELTETVLMQHVESTASVLSALKSIGVRLAVDDFGTGYSSLSYLKRFPIDSLKIDQSFVQGITSATDDAPIVRAVITMAKSLKQRVIGEGVETEEQMAFLQAHGCDEGQGYYFSRPITARQFATLLETRIASFMPPSGLDSGHTIG